MKNILRLLIAIMIIVGTGAVSFYAYTTYAQGIDLITIGGSSSGMKVLNQLDQLSSLTLSGAIFQTPTFQSLVDFSVPVIPEPVSRLNPFAPIGQNSGQ
jgi:hypothetical protein